jgi:hypothetical protein
MQQSTLDTMIEEQHVGTMDWYLIVPAPRDGTAAKPRASCIPLASSISSNDTYQELYTHS